MLGKTLALIQSSYIPWKGYFDLINRADEFILFDDAQYTRRDWRNRNQIKTKDGLAWLTIPVHSKGKFLAAIKDITVSDPHWNVRHWKTITASYRRARYFECYAERFRQLYLDSLETSLSQINYRFIKVICEILGITTKLSWSMDFELAPGKTERIVDLCRQTSATTYLSGPSARAYLDEDRFRAVGVELLFFDYSSYPQYSQLFPPFVHQVSVLDLIFNEGPNATWYMLSF